jgi:hypothetical protein
MDLHNNEVGIQYCSDCYPGYTTDQTISNGIMQLLLNGEMKYLDPLDFDISPYWPTGLNGITSSTAIKWTNQ